MKWKQHLNEKKNTLSMHSQNEGNNLAIYWNSAFPWHDENSCYWKTISEIKEMGN